MLHTEEKIAFLLQTLQETFIGRCAVAIAGSHAKGLADEKSDIDLFLYIEEPKPFAQRKSLMESIADPGTPMWISPDFHDGAWGGSMDFTFQGTPVETTVKLLKEFEPLIDRTMEGEFEIIPANWTANGYYSYICLSEMALLSRWMIHTA